MDISDIHPGDVLWHKHHRCIVQVTNILYDHTTGNIGTDPDRDAVECYRKHTELPLKTHPSLLRPIKVAQA